MERKLDEALGADRERFKPAPEGSEEPKRSARKLRGGYFGRAAAPITNTRQLRLGSEPIAAMYIIQTVSFQSV
jgi:hypothetical protein